ncbi:MAG: hypothetical protein ACYDBV_13870 [Nitrospiria bacterium]
MAIVRLHRPKGLEMRRALMEQQLITEGETIIGINLGFDFCAEHEWGIKGLIRRFGIPGTDEPENFGIKGRTITYCDPDQMFFAQKKLKACLTFEPYSKPEGWNHRAFKPSFMSDSSLITAWSEDSFGIIVEGKQQIAWLKELYEAFKRLDVAIGLGINPNPFSRGGLVILIASKFSTEAQKQCFESDRSHFELTRAFKETGIEELLKAAGKKSFSLRPDWIDRSEGTIRFWLNPYDQQKDNWGWFTLEELKLWVENKGPIPKQKK